MINNSISYCISTYPNHGSIVSWFGHGQSQRSIFINSHRSSAVVKGFAARDQQRQYLIVFRLWSFFIRPKSRIIVSSDRNRNYQYNRNNTGMITVWRAMKILAKSTENCKYKNRGFTSFYRFFKCKFDGISFERIQTHEFLHSETTKKKFSGLALKSR